MTRSVEQMRADIVAEAKAWLRTPWHHLARVRGVGVDCAQLFIGVYAGAGVIAPFDTGVYPCDWHIHKDVERFAPIVQRFAEEIEEADALPADMVLMKIGRVYSHGGILVDKPRIIHADIGAGIVTYCDLKPGEKYTDYPRRWFRYKGWGNVG